MSPANPFKEANRQIKNQKFPPTGKIIKIKTKKKADIATTSLTLISAFCVGILLGISVLSVSFNYLSGGFKEGIFRIAMVGDGNIDTPTEESVEEQCLALYGVYNKCGDFCCEKGEFCCKNQVCCDKTKGGYVSCEEYEGRGYCYFYPYECKRRGQEYCGCPIGVKAADQTSRCCDPEEICGCVGPYNMVPICLSKDKKKCSDGCQVDPKFCCLPHQECVNKVGSREFKQWICVNKSCPSGTISCDGIVIDTDGKKIPVKLCCDSQTEYCTHFPGKGDNPPRCVPKLQKDCPNFCPGIGVYEKIYKCCKATEKCKHSKDPEHPESKDGYPYCEA